MDTFLTKALQALPEIAISPLAMFAYIVTIGAYVLVALRVRRHRDLLQYLTALPEKDRLSALESELGNVKPRTGVTAEQWLRSRIHHYYFLAFLATCITVIVIVSLILYRTRGSVDIDVTGYHGALRIDRAVRQLPNIVSVAHAAEFDFSSHSEPRRSGVDRKASVRYNYEKKDGRVVIRPTSALLDSIRNGEEVEGFNYWLQPFDWQFPVLSVKVANNTDRTLLLSEAKIEVLSSNVDTRPVLIIKSPSYYGAFGFLNEGWGEVLSPKLVVTMNDPSCGLSDASVRAEPPVTSFLETQRVNLSPFVGNELRREVTECSNEIESICMDGACSYGYWEDLKCIEPFDGSEICRSVNKPLSADDIKKAFHYLKESSPEKLIYMRQCRHAPMCVKGTLNYVGEDGRNYTYKFRTFVFLNEPGMGAPAPPSYTYDIFLKAGKSGYVVTRDLSQEIKPGQTDHFLLRVATDKSSNFQLKLSIKDTKGNNRWSGHVDMEAFVPRSGASLALRNLKY